MKFVGPLTLVCALLSPILVVGDQKPFYQTLNPPPAPELSPEEALTTFSIAPGFTIELVAAEPLVEDPVAITWDEAGSLYVVEMRGFMPDAWGRGDKNPVGMVVRLDDTKDDGNFDARTIMLDGLVLPRAVAIVNEGLLIGEPPNLWLCPGKTKNISCEEKVNLGEYGNQPGSVEHAENKLLLGLDNWIYNAKSDRRMKIINGELITEPTLFRGQWGITQDNNGNLYYNTNSNFLLGDIYDAQPIITAGNHGAPGLNTQISKNDQIYAVRVNPGVNRAYVPGVLRKDGRLDKPTSASGMVAYRGSQFPERFRNRVFVAEPAANAVAELALTKGQLSASTEHILYPDEIWQQREFLASTDERFRPVDVSIGPDGALYVIDMYRGIIQDHIFLTDQLRNEALSRGLDKPLGKGRIWRVTAQTQSNIATQAVPETDHDLVKLLAHENSWHRETAQRLLAGKRSNRTDRRLRRLINEENSLAAAHATWTLQGRGKLNRKAVKSGLDHPTPDVQLSALRAGHDQLNEQSLLQLAASQNQDLAHHATMYLQSHNESESVMTFLASQLANWWQHPIRRAGIRSAAAGNEMVLVSMLSETWSEAAETETALMQEIFSQALRGTPDLAGSYLDQILASGNAWMQQAMLRGLQDVSADEGFERIELAEAHKLFTEPPGDIWPAISLARRSFTWPGDELAAGANPLSPTQKNRMAMGKEYYSRRCSICHRNDGRGITSLGPPLVDSKWVTGPTEQLIRIILHGLQGKIEQKGETWNGVMPGHNQVPEFNDDTASGLLTYLHRAWGHAGRIIDPAFVAEVRQLEAERKALWTTEELNNIDINTHYRKFAGTYGGAQFLLDVSYNGSQLEISSVVLNGALDEQDNGQFLFAPRQFLMEFIVEGGEVTGLKALGMGGAVLPRLPRP